MAIKTNALTVSTGAADGKVFTSTDANGLGAWEDVPGVDTILHHAAMTTTSTVTITIDGDADLEIEISWNGHFHNTGSADAILELRPNADNSTTSYYQHHFTIDAGTHTAAVETVSGFTLFRGYGGGTYLHDGVNMKGTFTTHQCGVYRGYTGIYTYCNSNGPRLLTSRRSGVWKGTGNITSLAIAWNGTPASVDGYLKVVKKAH